jgi:hypothetical protein
LSITAVVLVFVGIPALVVLAVYGAVYGGSGRRVSKRYRPGRPFAFAPVWFLAGTDDTGNGRTAAPALGAADRRELPGPLLAQAGDGSAPNGSAPSHGETGGASDRW